METPQQTIGRLLTALETLTREEEHLFDHGLYAESTAVQQRSMPLVRKIAELLVGPNVAQSLEPAVQTRIQTLLQNRRAHYDRLSAQLEATQKELEKINAAQARARRLRPVYHQPAIASFASEA
jgi:Skp family chaperone for outer membrane proteins